MSFSEVLNNIIDKIGCSAKELSDVSGISSPVISKYRKGTLVPKYKSDKLESLISSLVILAKNYKIFNLREEDIRNSLEKYIKREDIDFEVFRNNFNILVTNLKINVSDLAKYIGFDSSFVSKIRSGIRKPSNLSDFANGVCKFVLNNYINDSFLMSVIDNNSSDSLHDKLYFWLTNNTYVLHNEYDIDNFIKKLNDFDLNNYIKAIKFDKLFTPTLPKFKSKSRVYYASDGYKDAQLDFLRKAAFLKSRDDIFWYNNMAIIDASKDLKFTKKYMMYLAFILKKGIKLNIVHDLDRPFKELMLGLEGWIPLYMTGQINPYYFKNNSNFLYSFIDGVSGNAILHGECVTGDVNNGKFFVSTKVEDIKFYRNNSLLLLKKASPLMGIYNSNKRTDFLNIINNNSTIMKNRRNILSDLPSYVLSDELLEKILLYNDISDSDREIIHKYVNDDKKRVKSLLKDIKITDEICIVSKEDFDENKCSLNFPFIYYDKKINYNYEDYLEHLNLLKKFKKNNKNYNYKITNNNVFKNLNIYIIEDKQVIISKFNKPITNFVIYHPQLVSAIQSFEAPINEKDSI